MTTYQLGRLARTHDPRIPHMSAFFARRQPIQLPAAQDWTAGMPAELGLMLNDRLGDCTCAAFYHALQVWSFNATATLETQPDEVVEQLYVRACGYNPGEAGQGPGGNVQQVLTYVLKQGAPVNPTPDGVNRIHAFLEVDPRHTDDVKRTIMECGVAYVGFSVPDWLIPQPPARPPALWDVRSASDPTVGEHAAIAAGYSEDGLRVISWGHYYTMTWRFLAQYADEMYAIASTAWIEKTGKTPGGLSLEELTEQMKALAAS